MPIRRSGHGEGPNIRAEIQQDGVAIPQPLQHVVDSSALVAACALYVCRYPEVDGLVIGAVVISPECSIVARIA
jgi:hypothetical protein